MISEKEFSEHLKTLSCNGCEFFRGKVCMHENGKELEADKFEIRKDLQEGEFANKLQYDDWMKNENDYYVCVKYKSK